MRSLRRLREQIVRANLLVQEASFIAEELERHTEYRVTLQIPSDNLNANRKVRLLRHLHTIVRQVAFSGVPPKHHHVPVRCVCVQRDAVLSEPAIQVRRRCRGKQIWSLEKMENRLVDMRELYQEWQDYHSDHEDNPVRTLPVLQLVFGSI